MQRDTYNNQIEKHMFQNLYKRPQIKPIRGVYGSSNQYNKSKHVPQVYTSPYQNCTDRSFPTKGANISTKCDTRNSATLGFRIFDSMSH